MACPAEWGVRSAMLAYHQAPNPRRDSGPLTPLQANLPGPPVVAANSGSQGKTSIGFKGSLTNQVAGQPNPGRKIMAANLQQPPNLQPPQINSNTVQPRNASSLQRDSLRFCCALPRRTPRCLTHSAIWSLCNLVSLRSSVRSGLEPIRLFRAPPLYLRTIDLMGE